MAINERIIFTVLFNTRDFYFRNEFTLFRGISANMVSCSPLANKAKRAGCVRFNFRWVNNAKTPNRFYISINRMQSGDCSGLYSNVHKCRPLAIVPCQPKNRNRLIHYCTNMRTDCAAKQRDIYRHVIYSQSLGTDWILQLIWLIWINIGLSKGY